MTGQQTAAGVETAGSVRSAWAFRLRWIAVGVAAALACVLLSYVFPPGVGTQPMGPEQEGRLADQVALGHEMGHVALLWCQTRDELSQTENDEWSADLAPSPADETESFEPTSDNPPEEFAAEMFPSDQQAESANDPLPVPSWMLAAVASIPSRADGPLQDNFPETTDAP